MDSQRKSWSKRTEASVTNERRNEGTEAGTNASRDLFNLYIDIWLCSTPRKLRTYRYTAYYVTIRELSGLRASPSMMTGLPDFELLFIIGFKSLKKNPVTKQVTVIIMARAIVGHCTG